MRVVVGLIFVQLRADDILIRGYPSERIPSHDLRSRIERVVEIGAHFRGIDIIRVTSAESVEIDDQRRRGFVGESVEYPLVRKLRTSGEQEDHVVREFGAVKPVGKREQYRYRSGGAVRALSAQQSARRRTGVEVHIGDFYPRAVVICPDQPYRPLALARSGLAP